MPPSRPIHALGIRRRRTAGVLRSRLTAGVATRFAGVAAALVAVIALAACGTSAAATPVEGSGDPDAIAVVASTNVWGDIASAIGGDLVRVDAFISDPAQDPHSFEASPRAQLQVAQAAVIIENGGGYDDFMDGLISASGTTATVINAVQVSGLTAPPGGDLNEHVWYDFATVDAVAGRIADALSAVDPSASADFAGNLAGFRQQLAALRAQVETIKGAHAGEQVAITEPVPLYLLSAAGLVNATPAEFSEAIEEGSDVPARVLLAMLNLFRDKQVRVLVYNSQTSGPQTDQVLRAAQDNGIPGVPVTETLPAGKDYLSWMQDNVSALAAALTGASGASS